MKLKHLFLVLCLLLVAMPVLAQEGEYTVNVAHNDVYGDILVGPTGMTLYTFSPDGVDSSVCSGQCLQAWPALTVESADALTADESIPGIWSTFTRSDDNTIQVAYNGQPLYYWFRDEKPGDATGHRVGHNWWVVPPATVTIEHHPELGQILMGPTGMTLYTFTNDTPGVSNCADQCAANWPPLTVASADDLVSGVNIWGEWGTISRADGSLQVTYNGWPLYYYAKDAAIGDATGEGVGEKWYTVHPESVGVADGHLTSFDGMTIYTFDNDTAGVSNCTGDCLKNWPPVKASAKDTLVLPAGATGTLGTITGSDGETTQLTYNDKPLYYFANDKAEGDMLGDGAGGVWHIVTP